jgi:1-acyl-sn-glycerol-3-phosphate acyltransferase
MAAMSGHETTSSVMRCLRLASVFLHLLRGLLISTLLFPFYSRARRREEIRKWSAALMHILGVQVHVHDAPVRARPLMLVSNHVSWLDIFALNSAIPMRFVAKSEIRRWPLIGWLSAKTGTPADRGSHAGRGCCGGVPRRHYQ